MILELRNIFKTYQQGKLDVPVLKNVSLSVSEGEYVAIMGPSGSGKTTLMNIIGCLDIPTSGTYLLEGEDLSQQSDTKMSEVRLRSIGFVFQSFYLLSRQSAIENVALPLLYAGVHRKERLEMAQKALERVGLGDRVEFKPTQLSGGQCQRVAIARAIVNSPKILLADEPTGALDTQSGEQIMEIFQKLNNEGVTIVMITHEPEIAAHAQRTLHIRDGRLIDEHGNFLASETLTPEEQTPVEKAPSALKEEAVPETAPSRENNLPDDVIPVEEFFAVPLEEAFPEQETEVESAIEMEAEPEDVQPARQVIPVELDFARDLGADEEPAQAAPVEEVLEQEAEVESEIKIETEPEAVQPARQVIPVELDFARDLGADTEPAPAAPVEEAPEQEAEVESEIEMETEPEAVQPARQVIPVELDFARDLGADTEPAPAAPVEEVLEQEAEVESEIEIETEPEAVQPARQVIPVELDFARDLGADTEPAPAAPVEEVFEQETEVESEIEMETEPEAVQPTHQVIPVELDFARDLGADEEPAPAAPVEEAPEQETEVESEIEMEAEPEAVLPARQVIPVELDFARDLGADTEPSNKGIFDIDSISVEDLLEPPELVTRPAGEGAAEQLAFNIWGSSEETEEASELYSFEEREFSEESPDAEPDAPEEIEEDGGFHAPLKLDVDLAQVLQAPPEGGFRKPIKVELDGLGLENSPSSAPEEDRR